MLWSTGVNWLVVWFRVRNSRSNQMDCHQQGSWFTTLGHRSALVTSSCTWATAIASTEASSLPSNTYGSWRRAKVGRERVKRATQFYGWFRKINSERIFLSMSFFSSSHVREKTLQRVIHQWWPGLGPPRQREQPRSVPTLHQQFWNRSRRAATQHLHRDGLHGGGRSAASWAVPQLSSQLWQLQHVWVWHGC